MKNDHELVGQLFIAFSLFIVLHFSGLIYAIFRQGLTEELYDILFIQVGSFLGIRGGVGAFMLALLIMGSLKIMWKSMRLSSGFTVFAVLVYHFSYGYLLSFGYQLLNHTVLVPVVAIASFLYAIGILSLLLKYQRINKTV